MIAVDERSYSEARFKELFDYAESAGLLNDNSQFYKLQHLMTNVAKKSKESTDLDSILGDVPDKYRCPLSMDIMKDPVRLPTSGNVCDRNMIKQILLDKEEDPFNRKPLKFDQVEPDTKLKAEIDAWVKAQVEKHRSNSRKMEIEPPVRGNQMMNTAMEEEKEEDRDFFNPYLKKF